MRRPSPRRSGLVATAVALAVVVAAPGAARADRPPIEPPTVSPAPWPERPGRVALVGDSIAAGVAAAVAATADARGMEMRTFTRVGCGVTSGIVVSTNNPAVSTRCATGNDAFLTRAGSEPVDAVVVMSSWEVNSHIVDGRELAFRTPEWDAWMTDQLDTIRLRFGGAPVLLATVAPRAPLGTVSTMSPSSTAEVLRYNQFLRDYVTKHPGEAAIVDVAQILCPAARGACPEYFAEVRPRPDLGAHFDAAGAAWFAPQAVDAVQQAWEQVGAVLTAPPGF